MDVVLDTNIFFSDFLMNSMRFQNLFDYIKSTESKIILPKIVQLEILQQYKNELRKRVDVANKGLQGLGSILLDGKVDSFVIDIEDASETYLLMLMNKLGITASDIVPYQSEYLSDIVDRAIKRVAPCHKKGEEFRDALLWLTLLDIVDSRKDKAIIFISNNTTDFSDDGEGSLHQSLRDEASARGVYIHFYPSISKFVEEHASGYALITEEWIEENISINFNLDVRASLNKKCKEVFIPYGWISLGVDVLDAYIDRLALTIEKFFVYERSDKSFYVQIKYRGAARIIYEFKTQEDQGPYIPTYDPLGRNQPSNISKNSTKIDVFADVGVVIKNGSAEEYDIESFTIV